MKTIREWFNELSEPYKTKAINNTEPDELRIVSSSLLDAINAAFIWKESPEGEVYWEKVFNAYLPKKTPPIHASAKPSITLNHTDYFGEQYGSLHIFGTAEAVRDINRYIALNWGGQLELTPEQEAEAGKEMEGGAV